MKLFTILALVGIAATAATATPTVVTTPQDGLANTNYGIRRFHHLAALPEQIHGYRVAVVGEPGTEYDVYYRLRDGTSFRIFSSVIPGGGNHTNAIWGVHDHEDERTDRVEIWSFANGNLDVHVDFDY